MASVVASLLPVGGFGDWVLMCVAFAAMGGLARGRKPAALSR